MNILLCGNIDIDNTHIYKYIDFSKLFDFKLDLVIGNLNTVFTHHKKKWPAKKDCRRADPNKVSELKKLGITHVNLANEHIADYRRDGFIEHLNILRNANINYTGAGLTKDKAKYTSYYIKNGKKVCVLSMSFVDIHIKAGWNNYGVWYFDIYNDSDRDWVKYIRTTCDLLIIYIHLTDACEITETNKMYIKYFILLGADIIQCISNKEYLLPIDIIKRDICKKSNILYDKALVIYNAGCLMTTSNKYLGFMTYVTFNKDSISFKIIPIKNRNHTLTLFLSGSNEKAEILKYLFTSIKNQSE